MKPCSFSINFFCFRTIQSFIFGKLLEDDLPKQEIRSTQVITATQARGLASSLAVYQVSFHVMRSEIILLSAASQTKTNCTWRTRRTRRTQTEETVRTTKFNRFPSSHTRNQTWQSTFIKTWRACCPNWRN